MFTYAFVAASPDPAALDGILQLASKYPWWQLAIVLLILYVPSIIAWQQQRSHTKAMKALYESYLKDKDREIDRQAVRIKELENFLLKTKRS